MTARPIAQKLVNITKLSSLYHQAVEELRQQAVKTTVDALYNRYRARVNSHQETRPFVEWLVAMEYFERTFAHRTTGSGAAVRRRWAFGYYNFLTRKELMLSDDPNHLWMIEALQDRLNAKHCDPNWLIVVETAVREEDPIHKLKAGTSFVFARVERPANPEENSAT